ncbi:unnamed protein product [Arctogadus glacialis]
MGDAWTKYALKKIRAAVRSEEQPKASSGAERSKVKGRKGGDEDGGDGRGFMPVPSLEVAEQDEMMQCGS